MSKETYSPLFRLKKLAEVVVLEAVTAKNTSLKVQLQIKEDLVTALKLKLDDSSNTSHATKRMTIAVLTSLPLKIES